MMATYAAAGTLTGDIDRATWLLSLSGVAAAALIALGLWLWVRSRRSLSRTIAALTSDLMRDVTLPEAAEGVVHIEYLALTPKGLVVIDVKDFEGLLFGAATIDHWTQVVDGHSYRFDNPLYQNDVRCAAVRAIASEVPVRGLVVFTDVGQFPKGIPERVCMLEALAQELGRADGPVPGPIREAWTTLRAAAE